MICLGIESTAHTLGASIVDSDGTVLSNEKDSYTTKEGGMIPYKLADHHVKFSDKIVKQALEKSGKTMQDVDIISFSQGPGIGHALRIGATIARVLAMKYDKPLVGVNHCIAHCSIGELFGKVNEGVTLYVSGANTQVISYEGGKYRVFGETLDIGIGNFLDSFARHLGLGFPGGPKISDLAEKGNNLIELPYVVKGMDVSFGGLLTKCKRLYDDGENKEDLCYSIQETIFAMVLEVAERALAHTQKKALIIAGGVGCNIRLKKMAKIMCKEHGVELVIPENQFLIDNAAMIAWQGIIEYNAGRKLIIEESGILPYWRTDDVVVNWK